MLQGNKLGLLKQKCLVQLDWVSTEDGSHILTVGVGTKILAYCQVSSEVCLLYISTPLCTDFLLHLGVFVVPDIYCLVVFEDSIVLCILCFISFTLPYPRLHKPPSRPMPPWGMVVFMMSAKRQMSSCIAPKHCCRNPNLWLWMITKRTFVG